jgi:maltooligosyltrehalose trehalohydrolase
LFFTDHHDGLGRRVTEGRRKEFRHFSAFSDPQKREKIPDPQALSTFEVSRLGWSERGREPHASVLRLYRELLRLRRTEPALRAAAAGSFSAEAVGDGAVALLRRAPDGPPLLVLCQLRGGGVVELGELSLLGLGADGGRRWGVVLTTEDEPFSQERQPPHVDHSPTTRVSFVRPGAVILRG